MPGYMQPCRHCDRLIPPDSNSCPLCGKVDPLQLRCPRCRNPIKKDYVVCNSCGLELKCLCPGCGKSTFLAITASTATAVSRWSAPTADAGKSSRR